MLDWILEHRQEIAWHAGVAAAAIAVPLLIHFVLFRVLRRISRKTENVFDEMLLKRLANPIRWLMMLAGVRLVMPFSRLPATSHEFAVRVVYLLFIGLVSWFIIKCTYVLDDYVMHRFNLEDEDNLQARKIHTQLKILKRIVIVVVVAVAVCLALMSFENVRRLGTAILASVGIIGIIVGMAAQKTIGTFIAGLQIAFTQPIRVDDVVIVENEWGRIEEITLTYVVVAIWDKRRLVVPITYFIEKPFQNWTRTTADIIGTVYLYVDYTVPIDRIREELKRILDASDLWDGKVCSLQVTGATDRTLELRALVSASDSSGAWNLRCDTRERLIEFVRANYPGALPRVRAELEQGQ